MIDNGCLLFRLDRTSEEHITIKTVYYPYPRTVHETFPYRTSCRTGRLSCPPTPIRLAVFVIIHVYYFLIERQYYSILCRYRPCNHPGSDCSYTGGIYQNVPLITRRMHVVLETCRRWIMRFHSIAAAINRFIVSTLLQTSRTCFIYFFFLTSVRWMNSKQSVCLTKSKLENIYV